MIAGKQRRLARILRDDGKTVIVPMDHPVSMGPIKGLEDMQAITDKLVEGGVDAIVVHKGIAKSVDTRRLGLIIHLSGSTILGPDPTYKVNVCSVEEAIYLGADAVSVHINVGSDKEPEMLLELGEIADKCDSYGMPLLAMMYPRGPAERIKSETDPEAVAHAARLGAELGADIVKTNYTGDIDSFKRVVKSCPVPVVVAGGPKVKSVKDFLQMAYNSIKAGAKGFSIGRNVFQHENPTLMARALVSIVHKGYDVEQALEILGSSR